MATDPSLRPAQLLAIDALAAGLSVADAADAAGCSARTLRRWRNEVDFAQAERQAVAGRYDDAHRILAAGMAAAATYLVGAAAGLDDIDHGRIQAARHVLALGRELRDQLELADRVAALEAAA
ncbi:MAG: helix-turn-helix domain-containing protein [Chloroflexi bacterium]|nr:helix-turn-helix domain-containing protein [Chloroflexota bacterium]